MDVYSVKKRTADLVQVLHDLSGRAAAMLVRMIVVTARTWVHAGDEHERARICDGVLRSRDIYDAILEGLSQNFEHRTLKFRQFIAKKDPIMGQTDFPRLRIRAASHKCHLRDGVVGRTEGTLGNEGTIAFQLACNRMNLRRLQTFS